jgi:hypothetical protein
MDALIEKGIMPRARKNIRNRLNLSENGEDLSASLVLKCLVEEGIDLQLINAILIIAAQDSNAR